jgi:hypothetical protein
MSSSDSSFSVAQVSQMSNLFVLTPFDILTLLLLLLSSRGGLLGRTASRSTTSSRSGSSGTTAGADVQEQVLDVLALEGLGEEGAPDGLDFRDLGGGDEGVELVGLNSGISGRFGGWKLRAGVLP